MTEREILDLPDDVIRSVILAWARTGSMCERDGTLSGAVCERVRAQMLDAEGKPNRLE